MRWYTRIAYGLLWLVARLPTGSTLRWNSAQGHLAGPLRLAGVQFTTPVQRDEHCQPTPASPCATGTLRLDGFGNIVRTPAWATYSGGQPVALPDGR